MGLLVGGYALFLSASFFRAAPISLLQPIFAFGLTVVAVLAVAYLKERFGALEWLGVVLLVAGVVLLGASAEEGTKAYAQVDLLRLLAFLAGAAVLVMAGVLMTKLFQNRAGGEVLYGLLAGVLLGIGYLNTKTFALAWRADRPGLVLLALAGLLVGLLGGLAVLQQGFQRGRALIVTAVNLVVNQVTVIGGGLFCLGESFPREPIHLHERLAGLGAILVGTVLLARFGSGAGMAQPQGLRVPQPAP
jgi:drug/metabolite transporter (DMT)-like permease